MRFNGWQWVGIAISLTWAIGAGIHQRSADLDRAQKFAAYSYNVCVDTKDLHHDKDLTSCAQEKEQTIAVWLEGSWGNVALIALGPIPLGWIVAYVLAGLTRALAIGLPVVIPWRKLSWARKVFVVVGIVTSLVGALLGLLTLSDLYISSVVPVGLAPGTMVMNLGPNVVTAKGTWTREGSLGEDSKLANPLQTSEITCYRTEGRCIEARASISGSSLDTQLIQYDIKSWSNTTIVFENAGICATELFTIDLITKSVNGAGHRIQSDWPVCNLRASANSETKWSYHLVNGFNIYWDLRQKARPLPLRLIQTLFGH